MLHTRNTNQTQFAHKCIVGENENALNIFHQLLCLKYFHVEQEKHPTVYHLQQEMHSSHAILNAPHQAFLLMVPIVC